METKINYGKCECCETGKYYRANCKIKSSGIICIKCDTCGHDNSKNIDEGTKEG